MDENSLDKLARLGETYRAARGRKHALEAARAAKTERNLRALDEKMMQAYMTERDRLRTAWCNKYDRPSDEEAAAGAAARLAWAELVTEVRKAHKQRVSYRKIGEAAFRNPTSTRPKQIANGDVRDPEDTIGKLSREELDTLPQWAWKELERLTMYGWDTTRKIEDTIGDMG